MDYLDESKVGEFTKEIDSLKKQLLDQSEKLESYSNNLNNFEREKLTWQEERKRLEQERNNLLSQAQLAQKLDTMAGENPLELIKRTIDLHLAKNQAKNVKRENPEADLAPVLEKLSSLEKAMEEEKTQRLVEEMGEAISDTLYSLKEDYNIEGDPKEVLQYMKRKGLYSPLQVEDAVKSFYMKQIIDNTSKKQTTAPATVLPGSGFSKDLEDQDNTPLKEGEDRWEKLLKNLG